MKSSAFNVGDEEIRKTAREFAEQYRLLIKPDPEQGYIGSSFELPMVLAHGNTAEQCVTALRDALVAAVAIQLKTGEVPPAPALRRARTEQINVRVSLDERQRIEEAARQEGFRGPSDFMRSVVIARLIN